jgi:hypothetical protein
VTQKLVFAWQDSTGASSPTFQVIVEFQNQGTGWVQQSPGIGPRFSILGPSGAVTINNGVFSHALPELVGPGDKGYLLEDGTWPNTTVAAFATVDVTLGPGSFSRVAAPPDASFKMNAIKWATSGSNPGINASGTWIDLGSAPVGDIDIAVLCIGKDGSILGAAMDTSAIGGYIGYTLKQPRPFGTDVATPPLKPSDCAKSIGLLGQSATDSRLN